MTGWTDRVWWSRDGLRLHYRDYAGLEGADDLRPPIICIPGLTRNARDFAPVAERLAGRWRVICVDLRGRGESAYAPDPLTYVPLTYMQDVQALLDELGVPKAVFFGSSLGGIVTMLLAAVHREVIAGALINDVGPVLEEGGLSHIRSYVGRAQNHPSWLHAARSLQASQGANYPRYGLEDWLRFAKRLFKLSPAGRVVLDYDMRIAEPFRVQGASAGVDLWPGWDALAGRPVTLLHGELSGLFSAETAREMARRVPDAELVTVDQVGHAPVLDEPEAVAAIDRLLARLEEQAGAGAL